MAPTISILVTTFNRSSLLRRAIAGIIAQTFNDFELIVIDDCSTDDTMSVVSSFGDPRIRYIRNEQNVGAINGDRAHISRFVYELMRGRYFVYHCDDDYWPFNNLLQRQIEAFNQDANVAFVMGNQLSQVLALNEPSRQLSAKDIHRRVATGDGYIHGLFPRRMMTGEEFLTEFAKNPTDKNRIAGGTLYSREHFIKCGALRSAGSRWQAGYEILIGPACVGKVVFLDDPCIVTEIRPTNASFRGTQAEHYLDSIISIECAFKGPISEPSSDKARLIKLKQRIIRKLSQTFMANTLAILQEIPLSFCDEHNISDPVTPRAVMSVYKKQKVWPDRMDLAYFSYIWLLYVARPVRKAFATASRARVNL